MTAQAASADSRQPAAYQWLNHYPKGVDWHQKLTPAPLYQLLDDAVAKFGSLLIRKSYHVLLQHGTPPCAT